MCDDELYSRVVMALNFECLFFFSISKSFVVLGLDLCASEPCQNDGSCYNVRGGEGYICKCGSIGEGQNCTTETGTNFRVDSYFAKVKFSFVLPWGKLLYILTCYNYDIISSCFFW